MVHKSQSNYFLTPQIEIGEISEKGHIIPAFSQNQIKDDFATIKRDMCTRRIWSCSAGARRICWHAYTLLRTLLLYVRGRAAMHACMKLRAYVRATSGGGGGNMGKVLFAWRACSCTFCCLSH